MPREILSVNTGFSKFTQSLIVWSCHTSCTLPSAGLKENKLERCKFNRKGSWKMIRFFLKSLFPSNHRLAGGKKRSNPFEYGEYGVCRCPIIVWEREWRAPATPWFVWRSKLCPRRGYL